MIKRIKAGKEIAVVCPNRMGVLDRIAKILTAAQVNIRAISARAAGGVGLIHVVVDHSGRAKSALRRKGFAIQENNVILLEVEDRPGILAKLTQKLVARKIDILDIYGSYSPTNGLCCLALATADNAKGLLALRR